MAILNQLANAALAKSLPAFDKWIRARLGDATRIGSAKMEGSRVVVEGASMMLGAHLQLEIDRATIAVAGRGLEGPHFYVESASGYIVVTGAGGELRARLQLHHGRDRDDMWLAGEVLVEDGRDLQRSASAAEDRRSAEEQREAMGLGGALDIEVSRTRWQLRGQLALGDATHDVEAHGRIGAAEPIARLHVEVRESPLRLLLQHAEAWLDSRLPALPIGPSARGTGTLTWQEGAVSSRTSWSEVTVAGHPLPGPITVEATLQVTPASRRATGEVTLQSARSSLRVSDIDWHATRLKDARIEGRVAVADALYAQVELGPMRLAEHGEAAFRLRLSGGVDDWCASGDVSVGALAWGLDGGPPAVFSIERGSAEVTLDLHRATLTKLAAWGYGTCFEGEAELPLHAPGPLDVARPLLVLRFADADHRLLCAVAALRQLDLHVANEDAGPRPVGAHRIGADARLSGRVSLARDREVRGELALESRDTALILALTLSAPRGDEAGHLDGTQLRGRVSARDAIALGWLDGPIGLVSGSLWNLRADVKGPLAKPSVEAQLETASCRVTLWDSVELPLTEVSASIFADREAWVWRAARAKLWSGQVETEGVRGFTSAFHGIDCALSWTNVAVGSATLLGTQLGEHLIGRSRGTLHARRLDDGGISGDGRVQLDDVSYLFIRFAQRQLSDVGLPLPHVAGTSPLRCSISLSNQGIQLAAIDAATDEITVRGAARLGFDGALGGQITARLRGGYLQKSPLFVIPASIAGGITVPVAVGGTVAAPRLAADLRTALRDKLGTEELSTALTGAVVGLRVAADGARGAIDSFFTGLGFASPSAHNGGRELEAIVARCLADDPNTDELIDRLIDAGVTSDDIIAVLERRRAR